ncbi:PO6F1 factor, partial [Chroicocephalus maculipennis]|nr:PO6F1 factor [Chroicocephalus maculipennis]
PGADGRFGAYLQVIVMSSHETIRVLEVGVDAPLPAEEDRKAVEMPAGEVARGSPGETGPPGREDVPPSTQSSCSGEPAGKTPSFPGTHSLGCPCSLHPCKRSWAPDRRVGASGTSCAHPAPEHPRPQLRTQGLPDVPACPRLTLSPSLCSAAAAVLNTAIQAPVQPAQPLQAAVQPRAPLQPPGVFPAAPGQPPILPQPPAAPTPPVAKPLETQTQITVQPAGFAFNPGIISAASLGGQTQLLGSLAAAPAVCRMQPPSPGSPPFAQVIGTLPWVVNPPGMAASPVPAALPAQNLQVQTVTPQLLLNAQGQVIATLAGSTIPAAAIKKTGTPEPPTKNEVQPIQPAPALSQPAVVMANPAPAAKASSAPVPITCSETPTVSQLVSKPPAPNSSAEEDGINLEEIREFAKNFKIRRLSLGLTQTQVGQALTATEGPAYSQSAICRYHR